MQEVHPSGIVSLRESLTAALLPTVAVSIRGGSLEGAVVTTMTCVRTLGTATKATNQTTGTTLKYILIGRKEMRETNRDTEREKDRAVNMYSMYVRYICKYWTEWTLLLIHVLSLPLPPYLMYMILSSPSEGAGIITTEYEEGIIVRMTPRRIKH